MEWPNNDRGVFAISVAADLAGLHPQTLRIYEREGLFERAAEMSPYFPERVFALRDLPQITDIRGYGMLAGFDLAPSERPGGRGYEATKKLFAHGMHIKFTGDSGIIAPALIAENFEMPADGGLRQLEHVA